MCEHVGQCRNKGIRYFTLDEVSVPRCPVSQRALLYWCLLDQWVWNKQSRLGGKGTLGILDNSYSVSKK